jgi:hypothetical protein
VAVAAGAVGGAGFTAMGASVGTRTTDAQLGQGILSPA